MVGDRLGVFDDLNLQALYNKLVNTLASVERVFNSVLGVESPLQCVRAHMGLIAQKFRGPVSMLTTWDRAHLRIDEIATRLEK